MTNIGNMSNTPLAKFIQTNKLSLHVIGWAAVRAIEMQGGELVSSHDIGRNKREEERDYIGFNDL